MHTVREINDLEELASLAESWHALVAKTPGASFFHTFEWLATYWAHFGAGQRLRVLAVSSPEGLVGILPLVVRQRRRIPRVRVLGYPLDDWGSFYGPIGPDPSLVLEAGLDHVRRAPRDWDVIELAWVDALGSDQGRTEQALRRSGLTATADQRATSALIDLATQQDWSSYWGSRSSRWRNNIRRSDKRLAAEGRVTHVRYRPGGSLAGQDDPRWDLYDACERIASSSWQGDSRTGTTLSHVAIRPFLRVCHVRAAAAGALDLNLLCVDGRAVAFNYAYHTQGYVLGLRTGFEARQAFDGAGSVLQARMIEDSLARGDRTYDLGPGYLECKRYWLTETRAAWRYTHFAPTAPIAQLMRARRTAKRWLSARV